MIDRGPGQIAYLPTLDELTLIPENHDLFLKKVGGRPLFEHMRALGLKMWQDAQGDYWIGLGEAAIHEHDRWFYMIPWAFVEAHGEWIRVTFRAFTKCHGTYIAMPTDILSEISELNYRFFKIRSLLKIRPDESRERITLNLLLAYRMFNELSVQGMMSLARGRWTPETHDILNHFPEWRAKQDLADMPLDLILHTYGLGWYAEDRHLA